jgi:hypothetical protein
MTGVVQILTTRHALVGQRCVRCRAPLRVGQWVVVKPTVPARHEGCNGDR